MQTLHTTLTVPHEHELRIPVPITIPTLAIAEVHITFRTNADAPLSYDEKMRLMEQASTDPLFLADLHEVAEDFRYIDGEIWEE
jgi:hypothetical protein